MKNSKRYTHLRNRIIIVDQPKREAWLASITTLLIEIRSQSSQFWTTITNRWISIVTEVEVTIQLIPIWKWEEEPMLAGIKRFSINLSPDDISSLSKNLIRGYFFRVYERNNQPYFTVGDLGSIKIISILCWFYTNCLHNFSRPGNRFPPDPKLRLESLSPALNAPYPSFFAYPSSSFINIMRALSPPNVLLGLNPTSFWVGPGS